MKCTYHPDVNAVSPCRACSRQFCDTCLPYEIKGKQYCSECWQLATTGQYYQMKCTNHPEVSTVMPCRACSRQFCNNCLPHEINGKKYCRECWQYALTGQAPVATCANPGHCEEADIALRYAVTGVLFFGVILAPVSIGFGLEAIKKIKAEPEMTGLPTAVASILISSIVLLAWIVGIPFSCFFFDFSFF